MVVPAAGSLSEPFENLRTLLAETAEFQSWVGAGTPLLAKNFIHMVQLAPPANKQRFEREELDNLRPFALIGWPRGTGLDLRRIAGGSDMTFIESGPLFLGFEDKLDPLLNLEDNFFTFTNHVGNVFTEMAALAGSVSGTKTFLTVKNFTVDDFFREDPDAREDSGDYWWLRSLVEWDI